jgi:hypothetical protein
MPKSYGQCAPGGPLNAVHVPIPTGVVTHSPPVHATPKPLPALATGSRDYVRRWATSHGMRVATVGALPKNVLAAYEAACHD